VTNGWHYGTWGGGFCYYPLGLCTIDRAEEVDWFAKRDRRVGRLEHYTEGLSDDDLV